MGAGKAESLERRSHTRDGGWAPKAVLELATGLGEAASPGFPTALPQECYTLPASASEPWRMPWHQLGGLSLTNPLEGFTYQGHT